MREVGAYEAKTRLSELLDEVAEGQPVTITRHGRPVAVLVAATRRSADRRETIDLIRKARRGIRLGRLTVRQLITEGRR